MPKLFMSIFTHLKFSKCNKVKIEDIIILFELYQCSEKFNDTTKRVGSSCKIQDFIIKTLDAEAISQSRYFWIFFVQCFYKVQYFRFRIRVQFYTKFNKIFQIKSLCNIFNDIDNSFDSNPTRGSSSEIQCFDCFISQGACIMIDFFFQCFDIVINQCIRRIYGHTIE